eukprot:14489.XXX_551102_551296_1 [CDS] Oithona nana genome sequencing.
MIGLSPEQDAGSCLAPKLCPTSCRTTAARPVAPLGSHMLMDAFCPEIIEHIDPTVANPFHKVLL